MQKSMTLIKEIKENINRWRNNLCSWVERNNTVKVTVLPNAIYRVNVIPIKLSIAFFTELEQKTLTICMDTQKTTNSQRNLEKEEWSWRNQPSWLQSILKSYSHWHSMVQAQKQNIDQGNKTESPEINPCAYGYLLFDKGGKNIQWGKDSLFNKWC